MTDILEFTSRTLGLKLSRAQSVLLASLYGLPLSRADRGLFRRFAGVKYRSIAYRIASIICGRRAGKSSRVCVPVALHECLNVERAIPATERWLTVIVAPTSEQAGATFGIIADTVRQCPELASHVERIADSANDREIHFDNRTGIKVAVANLRSVRNVTALCIFAEEANFFQGESVVDSERALRGVLEALMPSMATVPNSKLVRMSSPWTKDSMTYDDYANREQTPDKLVWLAPSQDMNPEVTDAEIELFRKEFGDAATRREYFAEFSEEVNGFLAADDVDGAAVPDVEGIEPESADDVVVGAIDASQFSDHFAAAQASCTEEGFVTLNFATAQEPVNGKVPILATMNEVGRVFKENGVQMAFSDRVSSTTVEEVLAQYGIGYERVVTMGDGAVEMFSRVAALFRAGRVRIPGGNKTLVSQLKRLKMILQPGGGVRVEAKTGHDDQAMAACIAIFQADQHKFSKSWAEVIRL